MHQPTVPPGGFLAESSGSEREETALEEPGLDQSADEAAPSGSDGSSRNGALARWTRLDTIALAAVTLVGAALRVVRLDAPSGVVFDEFFYARDGCWYVKASRSACGLVGLMTTDREVGPWLRDFGELTPEHPPLGKWLIGAGIKLFGFRPGAWRLAPAVAGTLTVAALYLLARKLLQSRLAATLASGLLAVDIVFLVQSRLAMLEIFVALFAVVGFLCCAYDRDRILGRGPPPDRGPLRRMLVDHRWRLAAGVAGGAAAASKLSGWLVVAGVGLLVSSWEVGQRRRDGRGRAFRRTAVEEGPSLLLSLGVVPVLVYALANAGRLDGSLLAWPWADGSWVRALVSRQRLMLEFHGGAIGRSSSAPWTLPMLVHPVRYFQGTSDGQVRAVILFANPLVWWPAFAALAWAALRWVRRGAPLGPEGSILIGFAATYAAWVLLTRGRPEVFLYYVTPAIPFLCLALGYGASRSWTSRAGRVALVTVVAASVVGMVFSYPALTAVPMSPAGLDLRIDLADQLTGP